jgi:hypothetical protein
MINEGQCMYPLAQPLAPTVDWCYVARMTIDVLPDNTLLEIFDFYLDGARMEAWITLVHACQKWRSVVFGSPSRLNLRLHLRARTPVGKTLGVWPLLPIVISGNDNQEWGVENIIAALQHNDRVRGVELSGWHVRSSEMEKVLTALQEPFPALEYLDLVSKDITEAVVPDSFLGGSAPRLRSLSLDRIPFPSLPKLFLSATDLVHLSLCGIPLSGYISPEAMVTGLSTLTSLKSLWLEFQSSSSSRESRRPPPPTRTLLPALTHFEFKGFCEYFEHLVERIDTPLLDDLKITFFYQFIFDTPQLAQFISRTPKFKSPNEAYVKFSNWDVSVTLPQAFDGAFHMAITCGDSLWQLSSLSQVCISPFYQALIPTVEHLYILDAEFLRPCWQGDIDDEERSLWLEILRSFTAVKNLYLYREFVPYFAGTLQDLNTESVTEVLPALQRILLEDPWLSGSVQENIKQFVAVRRLFSDPIDISLWNTDREKYKWYEIVDW